MRRGFYQATGNEHNADQRGGTMKNIEHVYPIAHQLAADFAAQREEALDLGGQVTAYQCFLDLEYNHPRPLALNVIVNRYIDDEDFDPVIAEEALEWWQATPRP